MKLLIIVTLIALSSATWMRSNQKFLQILSGGEKCGALESASMCGCQLQGCSFDSANHECLKVKTYEDPKIFTAGVLGGCNQASTHDSCINAVAWTNRYGGKTACAWCSGVCVRAAIADETCARGKGFDEWVATQPTKPAPRPTPQEEEHEEAEEKKVIFARVIKNGGLDPVKAKFAATLVWNNCNDLDLWLTTPAPETVRWSRKRSKDGAFLDIDMNADQEWEKCESREPVENVRYEDDGKKLAEGVYTITVHYYKKQQEETKTPYTLAVKIGKEVYQMKGDPASFGPEERDNYYVKVEASGKACLGLKKSELLDKKHKC